MANFKQAKTNFQNSLDEFTNTLNSYISTADGQWTIKGFIDVYKNVYTISSDTKLVSKILEIHLFPKILQFATEHGYNVVLPEHQNYYPDISFVHASNENIKFAVDFKTTYRNPRNSDFCNGFTLGSHGEYFINRKSTKNIQYPYSSYNGHFCLGIIYSRSEGVTTDETKAYALCDLQSITSVINSFQFFSIEKWRIASDTSGSGNTANIGSIKKIDDILRGHGPFSILGEQWFDDYWMNYRKITTHIDGEVKNITNLKDFVEYRNGNTADIVDKSKNNQIKRLPHDKN